MVLHSQRSIGVVASRRYRWGDSGPAGFALQVLRSAPRFNTVHVLLATFHLILCCKVLASVSGVCLWTELDDVSFCYEQHICSPGRLSWYCGALEETLTTARACDVFRKANVRNIQLYGDSYVRHFYQALVITLTGNYKNPFGQSSPCFYSRQFSEKICRSINHDIRVCNDTLSITYYAGEGLPPLQCNVDTLALLSVGNHPTPGRGRDSINDADAYIRLFEDRNYCMKNNSVNCSLYWMSTHCRPTEGSPGYDGEKRENFDVVREYNEKMSQYFQGGGCGTGWNYLDVFNMTDRLVHQHSNESWLMTFDHAHWGMEVNLIKAQIFLRQLVAKA